MQHADFLSLWEKGRALHPLDQGLLAIHAAFPEATSIADWPLGQRNRALAELHFGAAVFNACFKLAEAFALGGHNREVLRRDGFGQAHSAKARFPRVERGGVLFFGLLEAAVGGADRLLHFAVLIFDRHHAFELGEVAFGMLQAQAD